jgi:hypothetical protein
MYGENDIEELQKPLLTLRFVAKLMNCHEYKLRYVIKNLNRAKSMIDKTDQKRVTVRNIKENELHSLVCYDELLMQVDHSLSERSSLFNKDGQADPSTFPY